MGKEQRKGKGQENVTNSAWSMVQYNTMTKDHQPVDKSDTN